MSLRDQVASRPRRKATVRLARGDLRPLQEQVAEASRVVRQARADGADTSGPEAALADAQAALDAAHDTIELEALAPAAFEALQATHTAPDGQTDVPGMRPALLAASCVDESLQDAAWWQEQATSGALTSGELQTLWIAAYTMNAEFGSISAPKG